MKQILELKVFKISLIIPWPIAVLIYIIVPEGLTYTMGILLGGLMGALILRVLTFDIYKLLQSPDSEVQKKVRRDYFKRYLLYGATLAISITNSHISFGTTLIGLLLPRLVTIILVFRKPRRNKRGDRNTI